MLVICDLCRQAIMEELDNSGSEPGDMSSQELAELAADLGAEIPDHNCEATEDDSITCKCGCKHR